MKKSRFTESQIVGTLKEGEAGVPIAEIVRKHGISRGTYFNCGRVLRRVSVGAEADEGTRGGARRLRGGVSGMRIITSNLHEGAHAHAWSRSRTSVRTLRAADLHEMSGP
jgi:hypothetical protein